jgi:hypothetical protein
MTPAKSNLTVSIDSRTRKEFLSYCEKTKVQKGGLLQRLIDAFLKGETFTKAQVGEIQEQ